MQKHIKTYLKYFNIGEQDNWRCEHCGKIRRINNGLEIHHIIFKSQGGKDNIENLICLCVPCHQMAHNNELSKDDLMILHRRKMAGATTGVLGKRKY